MAVVSMDQQVSVLEEFLGSAMCSCPIVLPGDRQRLWLPWWAPRLPSLESQTMQESTASDSCYFLSQWSGKRKPSKVGELLTMQNPRVRKHKMTWSDWNSKTSKMQLWKWRDKDGRWGYHDEGKDDEWRRKIQLKSFDTVNVNWWALVVNTNPNISHAPHASAFPCARGIHKIVLPWTIFELFSSIEEKLFLKFSMQN